MTQPYAQYARAARPPKKNHTHTKKKKKKPESLTHSCLLCLSRGLKTYIEPQWSSWPKLLFHRLKRYLQPRTRTFFCRELPHQNVKPAVPTLPVDGPLKRFERKVRDFPEKFVAWRSSHQRSQNLVHIFDSDFRNLTESSRVEAKSGKCEKVSLS